MLAGPPALFIWPQAFSITVRIDNTPCGQQAGPPLCLEQVAPHFCARHRNPAAPRPRRKVAAVGAVPSRHVRHSGRADAGPLRHAEDDVPRRLRTYSAACFAAAASNTASKAAWITSGPAPLAGGVRRQDLAVAPRTRPALEQPDHVPRDMGEPAAIGDVAGRIIGHRFAQFRPEGQVQPVAAL